ncbi:pentraxin-related protein PTX3-like [Rhinoraja longicauda]
MAAIPILLWSLLHLTYILATDYEDVHNINGMGNKISVLPDGSCRCQKELTKWDKLFVMLENSQMQQNMLQHAIQGVCRVDCQRMQSEMHRVSASFANTATKAVEKAMSQLAAHADKKLGYKVDEFGKSMTENESEQKNTLQQLLTVTQDLSARLQELEMTWQKVMLDKSQGSSQDGNKSAPRSPETFLNSLELTRPGGEVRMSQRCSAEHTLPSGYEMALIFPMRSRTIYASVHPDAMTLSSFTASVWVKASVSQEKTVVFSYGTKRNPFEIQLYFSRSSAIFSVHSNGSRAIARDAFSLGEWSHLCASWDSGRGNAALWVNGHAAAILSGVAVGHVIPDRGLLTLGQEKNGCCLGGGFDKNLAFAGKLTGFNIWDRVLSEHEIQGLASRESSRSMAGSVVAWGVTEVQAHGGAAFIYH